MSSFQEQLDFEGHRLGVVPSVHFRTPFAERINYICRHPESRPDAVAVELGPRIAQFIYEWFCELHSEGRLGRHFPCMIAVSKPNRRIRKSMMERAIRLQKETGCELEELGSEVLNKVLGYSSESIFFLSPGDSIVEAIRCAVELKIPVYGIDLEEVADADRRDLLIRGTDETNVLSIVDWIDANFEYADQARDPEIDERREIAMGARLKSLLRTHRSVLFACGAAHWKNVRSILHNDEVAAAIVPPPHVGDSHEFTRLLVHPSLAIYYLMPFPAWVEHVEKNREPASSDWHDEDLIRATSIRPRETFDGLIKASYVEFLRSPPQSDASSPSQNLTSYAIHDFQTLLNNVAVFENQAVPDIFSVATAAQGTISTEFRDKLIEKLFRFDWADPKLLGLPMVIALNNFDYSNLKVRVVDVDGQEGRSFYINDLPGFSPVASRTKVPCPSDLEAKYSPPESAGGRKLPSRLRSPGNEGEGDAPVLRTWDATDDLFSIMCCRASVLARQLVEETDTVPFEGTMGDGIAVKAIARATATGDDRIYVKHTRRSFARREIPEKSWEPIVWILDMNQSNANWNAYSGDLDSLKSHCVNDAAHTQELESVISELGDHYLAAMTYGRFDSCASHYAAAGIKLRITVKGVVYFIPPSFREAQDLFWMQRREFRNVPILPGTDIESVERAYRERHGFQLEGMDWASKLIALAIPYCESTVIVAAPQHFEVAPTLLHYARSLNKSVATISTSLFPRSVTKHLRTNYAVERREQEDGNFFKSEVSQLLNEESDRYRHRVPSWLFDMAD